ncbi:hypothetical protein Tco_0231600 [Tanacetum coccineum]
MVYHQYWIGSCLDCNYFVRLNANYRDSSLGRDCDHDSFRAFSSYEVERRLEIRSRVERKLEFLRKVNSEEFVNVFMRIGFGSTIELVSFDKGQVVTFDSKFVCGFRNSDCGTRCRSDNMVSRTKSVGKVNLPTSTSIFSAIPTGYWNDLYVNLTLILVGLRFSRDNLAYSEYGMRLMLAPRSAKAFQEKVLLKLHGIRKLPRSPSLSETLYWIIAELHCLRKRQRFVQSYVCCL